MVPVEVSRKRDDEPCCANGGRRWWGCPPQTAPDPQYGHPVREVGGVTCFKFQCGTAVESLVLSFSRVALSTALPLGGVAEYIKWGQLHLLVLLPWLFGGIR